MSVGLARPPVKLTVTGIILHSGEYALDLMLPLFRYSREEVLGLNCRFMQGPGTSRSAVARLRKALGQQQKCTVQLLNYRKDGESV